MNKLLSILILIGANSAIAENTKNYELPFGNGNRKVTAIYHLDTEHWSFLPPENSSAMLSALGRAADLDTKEECDSEFILYKDMDKALVKTVVREFGNDGEADHYFKVQINYDGFIPTDPLFQKELTKIANDNGYKLSGLPKDLKEWSMLLKESIDINKIEFQWNKNSYSKLLGTDEIEDGLRDRWKQSALGLVMQETIKTKGKDFVCDLMTGNLTVKIPIVSWVWPIPTRKKNLNEGHFDKIYNSLRGSWESSEFDSSQNLKLKEIAAGYFYASAFRDVTKQALLLSSLTTINSSFKEYFDNQVNLVSLSSLNTSRLIEIFSTDDFVRSDYQYSLVINKGEN